MLCPGPPSTLNSNQVLNGGNIGLQRGLGRYSRTCEGIMIRSPQKMLQISTSYVLNTRSIVGSKQTGKGSAVSGSCGDAKPNFTSDDLQLIPRALELMIAHINFNPKPFL